MKVGGAGGARAPPEFEGSEKGRSLISAYQSLAITASTSGFEKLGIYGAVYGNFSDTLSEIISTHCELHCILSFEHARALQDISVHQCPGISYPTCQSPAAAVNSTSNFRLR